MEWGFFLFHSSYSHSPDHGLSEHIQTPYEKQLCQLNGRKLMGLFARLLWMHKPVAAALNDMTGAVVIFCTEGGCRWELCTADILVNSERPHSNTTLPDISASLWFSLYCCLLICGKQVYMIVLHGVKRNCFILYYLMHLFVIGSREKHKWHRKHVCPTPAKVRTELKIYCDNSQLLRQLPGWVSWFRLFFVISNISKGKHMFFVYWSLTIL